MRGSISEYIRRSLSIIRTRNRLAKKNNIRESQSFLPMGELRVSQIIREYPSTRKLLIIQPSPGPYPSIQIISADL